MVLLEFILLSLVGGTFLGVSLRLFDNFLEKQKKGKNKLTLIK